MGYEYVKIAVRYGKFQVFRCDTGKGEGEMPNLSARKYQTPSWRVDLDRELYWLEKVFGLEYDCIDMSVRAGNNVDILIVLTNRTKFTATAHFRPAVTEGFIGQHEIEYIDWPVNSGSTSQDKIRLPFVLKHTNRKVVDLPFRYVVEQLNCLGRKVAIDILRSYLNNVELADDMLHHADITPIISPYRHDNGRNFRIRFPFINCHGLYGIVLYFESDVTHHKFELAEAHVENSLSCADRVWLLGGTWKVNGSGPRSDLD